MTKVHARRQTLVGASDPQQISPATQAAQDSGRQHDTNTPLVGRTGFTCVSTPIKHTHASHKKARVHMHVHRL